MTESTAQFSLLFSLLLLLMWLSLKHVADYHDHEVSGINFSKQDFMTTTKLSELHAKTLTMSIQFIIRVMYKYLL